MSARNLEVIDPIPGDYKKEIIDSLRNCMVEYYENDNLVKKKYYSRIGSLYFSKIHFYDSKKRVAKIIEVDEYANDTCVINYAYTDSLSFTNRKMIVKKCDENENIDVFYKYNSKGEKVEVIMKKANTFYSKDIIRDINKRQRIIKSYDDGNRLSTYSFKYNEKDLLSFEKNKYWDHVSVGEYFEVTEENEYIYKYDKWGNWTERIKQKYCPKKNKPSVIKNKTKEVAPTVVGDYDFCTPEIKEKLIRKIFYK